MSSNSTELDRKIAKRESDLARQKKKSCKPKDNYGDNYVTGMEKLRKHGKGDRNRDIHGWYSDEVTERLKDIYGKKETK